MASFDENGKYIKTNWKAGDKITATKLNKIEESIEAVNDNDISRHVEADTRLDALEAKDVAHDKEFTNIKNTIADNKAAAELGDYEINSRMQFLEEELNEGIEEVHNVASTVDGKIAKAEADMTTQVNQVKADMEAMVAEVEADLEGLHAKDEEFSGQLAHIENSNFVDIRSYGAIPETDCTEIIQKAVNENKKVLITDGVYYINPIESICLKSGSILCVDTNATLKAIGVSDSHYQMISIHDVSNVKVFGGGKIIGDVDEHTGTTGEHGMGISIRGANNCEISDLDISKCWGDGVYLGASNGGLQNYSEFIIIRNIKISECRRQGMSIVSAKNTIMENIEIKNISGTDPQAGIDLEPNKDEEYLQNILIRNILTETCGGSGIHFYTGHYKNSPNIVNIKIENHTDKGSAYGFRARESMETTKGIVELKDCRWLNSRSHCFHIQSWSADNVKIKAIRPTVQVSKTTNYGYWISTQNDETNSELVIGGIELYEPNIINENGIIPDRGIFIDVAKAKAIKNIKIINPIQLFGGAGNTELSYNGARSKSVIIDDNDVLTHIIDPEDDQQYVYNQYRYKKRIISRKSSAYININSLPINEELEIINDSAGALFVRFYNSTTDYFILPINTKMAPIKSTARGSSITIKRLEDGNMLITNIVGDWVEV